MVLRSDVHRHGFSAPAEGAAPLAVEGPFDRGRIADAEHGFIVHVESVLRSGLHQLIDDQSTVNRRRQPARGPRKRGVNRDAARSKLVPA